MKKKMMMMGSVATAVAAIVAFSLPSDLQSQVTPGAQRAAELESEASRLLGQRSQWAYAADLYMAAVQLRTHEDPQAQEDLWLAANLGYETGDAAGAIAALESAATRALASRNIVGAADRFADAAWVAKKAGLAEDYRRLARRAAHLADSPELTTVERNEIMSRFEGR